MLLPANSILVYATDMDGFILVSLLNMSNLSVFKWQHVSSAENFKYISIGVNLRVWGISLAGNIYYRYGVDKRSNYCGTSWSFVESDEAGLQFKQLSVGNETVWAVSNNDDLYFRENISKSFHEGTRWLKIDSKIKHVTVNSKNQVYAITSHDARSSNCLLYRDGITDNNFIGLGWKEIIAVKF